MIVAKDKDGNVVRIHKDDPRFLSGELVHNMKGSSWYNNGEINKVINSHESIPEGFILGRIKKK